MQISEPPTGQACRYANDRRFRKILSSKYAAGSQDSRVHVRPQGYGEWLCRMLSGTLGCCKSTVDLRQLVGSHNISIGIRGIICWHVFSGGQGGVATMVFTSHLVASSRSGWRLKAWIMRSFWRRWRRTSAAWQTLRSSKVCGLGSLQSCSPRKFW